MTDLGKTRVATATRLQVTSGRCPLRKKGTARRTSSSPGAERGGQALEMPSQSLGMPYKMQIGSRR